MINKFIQVILVVGLLTVLYFTSQAIMSDGFNFAFFYQPDINNPWIFAVTTDLYLGFIVISVLIYLTEKNIKVSLPVIILQLLFGHIIGCIYLILKIDLISINFKSKKDS